ncbi:MAG TPA: FHA domain-containing protein, partial [Anaerolineae bacterium]|nr:FHA domain-containing protein [Anaerolineae bacterium]
MNYPSAYDPNRSQQPGQQQLQLVVHAGPLAGKGFPITGNTLTFGRGSDNDITLDDTQVSRNHARLIRQGDEVIIEDLGSTNGTLVNGKPIIGQHVLQPADIISIGSSVFGVKGFAAPHTIGVTQISMEKRNYPPPVAPPPVAPRIPSPAPPRPAPVPAAESSGLNTLVVGGIVALILIVVVIAAVTAYFLTQDRGSTVAGIPTVVITAPTPNSQVQVNVPVTVQATASDPAGVKRMELWVSSIKTADAISPVEQGQATLTASFQWVPPAAGSYTLEVKAFNSQGQVSAPTTVTVIAVGGEAATTETPTPTSTPETPTATVPTNPTLTTKTDLNVRSGPGTEYDLLGLLPAGVTVDIIGRE